MKQQNNCDERPFHSVPILADKHYDRPSVFSPANLLREARRQKALPVGDVPEICVLDPDGDLARRLKNSGARRNPHWACYHTELLDFDLPPTPYVRIRKDALTVVQCVLTGSAHVVQGGVWTTDAPFRDAANGNTAFVRLIATIAQAWRARP